MAEQKQVEVSLNLDTTPILYTDNVFIQTNEDGVVLNIGQMIVGSSQVRIVARVGMSREHGKKLIKEMGRLLAITEGQAQTRVEKN